MNRIFEKNLRLVSGFEGYPESWKETCVTDICQLGRGRVISQEEVDANPGDYPVYSSQTSDRGEMGRISTFDFEGELVTWTTDGANAGTVFYRDGKFNCTTVCGTLRARNEGQIDLKFLAYHLGRIAKNYVSYIGNPKLMNDVMGRIAFPLPVPYEQHKIAKILTTVDNLIEKTQALIDKYQAIKQGMMHDLFTRGVDEHGQLRPSYEDAPHLYKDSALGWIPREWEVRTLGALSISGLKNGYFKKPELVGKGYKLINVSELYQDFGIDTRLTSVERVEADPSDYENYKVEEGDIFFTRSSLVLSGIAWCNVIRNVFEPTLYECHVMRLKPNKSLVASDFLSLFCKTSILTN